MVLGNQPGNTVQDIHTLYILDPRLLLKMSLGVKRLDIRFVSQLYRAMNILGLLHIYPESMATDDIITRLL